MANEISFTFSLTVNKPAVMSAAMAKFITNFYATMTGNFVIGGTVSIATGGTAIPLGQVTQPHQAVFHNLDATNYVTLRNGAGGNDFGQLLAGEWAVIPLLTTSTPYSVANTAAVLLEYLIISL
jgi:hypothetical protein